MAVIILRTTKRFQSKPASCFGTALALIYLVLISLASSTQLHQALHPDANQPGHHCAITIVAQGQIDSPVCVSLGPVSVWCEYFPPVSLSFPCAQVDLLPPCPCPPAALS